MFAAPFSPDSVSPDVVDDPLPATVPESEVDLIDEEYTVTKFTNCKVVKNGQLIDDDLWVANGKVTL